MVPHPGDTWPKGVVQAASVFLMFITLGGLWREKDLIVPYRKTLEAWDSKMLETQSERRTPSHYTHEAHS